MTIENIVSSIACNEGLSKAKTRRVMHAFIQQIIAASKQDTFVVPTLGSFRTVVRNARVCRNPKTGEPVNVPQRTVLRFRPHKSHIIPVV